MKITRFTLFQVPPRWLFLHVGILTECKRIISMTEAFNVTAAPYCPLGPIALVAYLQVDATCHNAFIQDQSMGIYYLQENDLLDYLVDKSVFDYENGFCNIPQGPGIGIVAEPGGQRGPLAQPRWQRGGVVRKCGRPHLLLPSARPSHEQPGPQPFLPR